MQMTPRLRRRLGDDRGLVLPIAILVLLIVMMLGVVVITSSIQANTTSNKQTYADEAIVTAESGLQIAYRRLLATGSTTITHCFTTSETTFEPTETEGCTKHSEHGETNEHLEYKYYVEPLLTAAAKKACSGSEPTNEASGTLTMSCITSESTVGGITRRVSERLVNLTQAKAEAYESNLEVLGAFSVNNVVGAITMNIYADGAVNLNGAKDKAKIVAPTISNVTCEKCTEELKSGSAEKAGGVKAKLASEAEASAYTNALAHNAATTEPWEKQTSYNTSSHIVHTGGKIEGTSEKYLVMNGTYYMCEFNTSQEVFFKIPKGDNVTWYIDSPARSGSSCQGGTGNINTQHGMCVLNENKNPETFKIFMYGNPAKPTETEFSATNNLGGCEPLTAEVYAPYSKFRGTNEGSISGAFLFDEFSETNKIELVAWEGSTSSSASTVENGTSSWTICNVSKEAGSSLPGSGCS